MFKFLRTNSSCTEIRADRIGKNDRFGYDNNNGNQRLRRAVWLASSAATTLSMFAATPALAQDTEQTGENREASRSPEVIIVTAQKRAENVQDVPISITAFSGEYLEKNGLDDVRDIASYSPNLNITTQNTIGNTLISVRGVGSPGNSGIEPSAAVFIDGVYVPRSASIVSTLFDIQTFELLRGPQGTLFGRNTPMGAINITTRPASQSFEAYLQLEAGNFEQRSAKGYINGALSNTLSARASFVTTDRSGYFENELEGRKVNDVEEFGGRLKLLWEPNANLSINLAADYVKTNGSFGEAEFVNLTNNFVATQEAAFGVTITDTDLDFKTSNSVNTDDGSDENYGFSVQADLDVGEHTLTSISAYRKWDNIYTGDVLHLPGEVLYLVRPQGTEQFSQELRILSPTGRFFEYLAGLFYYKEDYHISDIFFAGPDTCLLPFYANNAGRAASCAAEAFDSEPDSVGDFKTDLESIAAFGEVTLNLSQNFKVTGGLRYTRDDKQGTFRSVNTPVLFFIRADEFEGDRTDEAITWRLNGRYFLNDDVMFFATVSTGFKSGGFNGRPNASRREFDEERTTNYELGVKSQFWDGRAQLNATLFRTKLEDFQDTVFDGETTSFEVLNAGDLRVQGLEADFQVQFTDQFSVQGGLAYLDSKYTDYFGAPVPSGLGLGDLPTIVLGCENVTRICTDAEAANGEGVVVQDLTGQRRQSSPKWQTSISAVWEDELPGASQMGWFARGEWQFLDEHFLSGENDPVSLEPRRSLFNARVGIEGDGGDWEVALWGRNLTDKAYCVSRFDSPLGGPTGATRIHRCNLGAPRTFGVTASFRY